MRQLILDLLPPTPYRLDNYVSGPNQEALAMYCAWLEHGERLPDEGIEAAGHCRARLSGGGITAFCLWGEGGAGKTHLLRASSFAYVDAADNPDLDGPEARSAGRLAVDNVEQLSPDGQIVLFNTFNRLRVSNGQLLFACEQPPTQLRLREDLRTRLGSGLIYRLALLSDQEKTEALTQLASARGIRLKPDILDYLLRHVGRDMGTLTSVIMALDEYSLEKKRTVTLPLLRQVLAGNQAASQESLGDSPPDVSGTA